MSIVVSCPACSLKLKVTEENLGAQGKCSGCGTVFTVEHPRVEAPPTATDAEELPYAPPRPQEGSAVAIDTPGIIRLGDGLSRGFEVLHSNVGAFLLIGFVWWAIEFGVGILTNLPLLGILITMVSIVFPGPQLAAGLCYACLRQHDGGTAEVGDLFAEFKNWATYALLALAQLAITIGALIVPVVLGVLVGVIAAAGRRGAPDEAIVVVMVGLVLVALLVGFFVAMVFCWVYPAIIDRRRGVGDAIRTSWTLMKDNVVATALTVIICGLLLFLGIILCFIGLIYTMPAISCVAVAAYRTAMAPAGGVPVAPVLTGGFEGMRGGQEPPLPPPPGLEYP